LVAFTLLVSLSFYLLTLKNHKNVKEIAMITLKHHYEGM